MKKYVILGGNGVFGVHCALWLLENASPDKVICVGRNPEKPEPFTLNVGKGDPRYEYHQMHVGFESDRLMDMLDEERPDIIINYAAQGEGAVSWKQSWRYFDTNATALARITEALMTRRYLERWIQIGTSELYGSVDRPAREDDPIRPSSPYAASKAAADMHLMSIAQVLNFPMNIVRPSNAYAPGQLLHRVLPKAVVFGLTGRKIPLHGGGEAQKSFIHARDLARAIWLVAEKAPYGRVYNVGPKDPISIHHLLEKTAKALGKPLEELVEISPARLGEDEIYWLDSARVKEELGWEPEISIEEGIADMVDWGRKYLDQLADWPSDYVLRA